VTFNVKDFPARALDVFGIIAQHPDEFSETVFNLTPSAVIEAVRRQRKQLNNPPLDADSFLRILHQQGLKRTAKCLADYALSI
jgi:UTP:GlnB (protein PII) uridylyltransferase